MAKKRNDLIDITIKIGDHPAVTFTDCVLHDFQMNRRYQTFIDWRRADSKPEEVPLPAECFVRFDCCGDAKTPETKDENFPRLYTADEITRLTVNGLYWMEFKLSSGRVELIQQYFLIGHRTSKRMAMYGIDWRVWTDKPTQRQQEMTHWVPGGESG